jgi:HD-GYP domain-containing protein (c-di-GMP phosphodiesterase class II)
MDRNQYEFLRTKSLEQVQNLLTILELKDVATLEHSNRVYALTRAWASSMVSKGNWKDLDIASLELSALMHDIGKVGILDEVLNKPGSLSEVERDHLEQHPEIGYFMIREFEGMDAVSDGVRFHHERWDGHGYPLGLRENQIPKIAQIISIVDTFDAITSERPYQKARTSEQAIQIIEAEAGRQFAPALSKEFARFIRSRNL